MNRSQAQTPGRHAVPIVYFVDGYHGGIEGHMPPGCMRNILDELQRKPWWKISLEIEPFSWDHLRRRDPQTFARLKALLTGTSRNDRVEIVSGSYAQPFCWAIGGESNIRQLVRGIEENRRAFPGLAIDTYAVQEPCFTSALPQILRSLGYKRGALKNFTCWGGYVAAGPNQSVVQWVGPDGSSLPSGLRYGCEGFDGCWSVESVSPTARFVRKCVDSGVALPVGTTFQDAGWPAHPGVDARGEYMGSRPENQDQIQWPGDPNDGGSHVRFVTWREFIDTIAPRPKTQWHVSQEDFRVSLPWGGQELSKLAMFVRSAENRLVLTEKLAAMAWLTTGKRWPGAPLKQAWDELMLAQHHDSWIVLLKGYGRRRDTWAWQSAALTWNTERVCEEVAGASIEAMSRSRKAKPAAWVRVFNTMGTARRGLVEAPVVLPRGCRAVRVIDKSNRPVATQLEVGRSYPDGTVNAGTALFNAEIPATGYATFRVEELAEESPHGKRAGVHATTKADGSVKIESDLYRIVIDPRRGGTMSSLVMKASGTEVVDRRAQRRFNEYRGFFTDQKKWLSSADSPAKVQIVENGPVRVCCNISGTIGPHPFTTRLCVAQGQRRIDLSVTLQFAKETRIGETWNGSNTHSSRRRPCYDDRYKLLALFPARLRKPELYKDAAFDVCRSENRDTFFNSWDTIKHNVILNWVDLYDRKADRGLALLSDRTTSYAYGPDHPLGLVLAFAGKGLWDATHRLKGTIGAQYALMPHAGTWDKAHVWHECAQWCEKPGVQVVDSAPEGDLQRSLVQFSDKAVALSALYVDKSALVARLFNASPDSRSVVVGLGFRPRKVELVELDGRVVKGLRVDRQKKGYCVRLRMPGFGIRSIRLPAA